MKLMILNDGEEAISGYEAVYIGDEGIKLDNVSDNECTEILVKNAFTQVSIDKSIETLMLLCSKLRRGGKLKFNGVDSRTLARNLIRGSMDDKQFNDIVYSCKSLISIPMIKEVIRRSGLKIETLTLNGISYDVTATR